MVDPGDEDLARRIGAGDKAAEGELVSRFQPGLLAIARIRAGLERAPDLAQDALLAAIENLRAGRWKGEGPLRAYVATILRRRACRGSAEPAEAPLPPDLPARPEGDAESLLDRNRSRRQVRAALAALSDKHREVVVRHYLEDESVKEIARALGIPRGTVLSRLHHARKRLMKTLNRHRAAQHLDERRGSLEGAWR